METQGQVQKILATIERLKQDHQKQSSYVDAATRGIKTLRQERKRAELMAYKIEGAIEAYTSSVEEISKEPPKNPELIQKEEAQEPQAVS